MNGAIFIETFKRSWRQMLYWSLGMAGLGAYIAAVLPSAGKLKMEMIEDMPPIMLQAFGLSDTAMLATPEGLIAFGFLTYGLLILLVFAVLAGLNVTANEEDDGILDLVLSLPIARWKIVAEKLAAYALMLTVILIASYVGLLIGVATTGLEIELTNILLGGGNMLFGLLSVMTFTAFVAVFVRRKATATSIVVSTLILMYFINFIGNTVGDSLAGSIRNLSFFRYADAQYVVVEGFNIAYWGLLGGVAVLFLVAALWTFERRDVGV
jgi:ABC-2 type transport system permease protein